MPRPGPNLLYDELAPGRPNIEPAGEAAWAKAVPSPSWPSAGVIPSLNAMWLRPGMLMETGTGFEAGGPRSTVSPPLPLPPPRFPIPGMEWDISYPPPGGGGGQREDWNIPVAMKALTAMNAIRQTEAAFAPKYELPKDLAQQLADAEVALAGFRSYRPMGEEGIASAVKKYYGGEPTLGFDPTLDSGVLSTEVGAPNVGGLGEPGDIWSSPGTYADYSAEIGPAGIGGLGGYPAGVEEGLAGLGGAEAASLAAAESGAGGAAVEGATGGAAGSPGAATGAAALSAGLMYWASQTEDSETRAALMTLAAIASVGGQAAYPGVGAAMLPLVVGPALRAQRYAEASWSPYYNIAGPMGAKFPPGFVPIPEQRNAAVNPETGAILWRKGRHWEQHEGGPAPGLVWSPQTLENRPVEPGQLIDWGIPSPLYPETAPVRSWTPPTSQGEREREGRYIDTLPGRGTPYQSPEDYYREQNMYWMLPGTPEQEAERRQMDIGR